MVSAKRLILLFFSLCALYYSALLFHGIYNYYHLTKTAIATSVAWAPDISNEEEVYLQVNYKYIYSHKNYDGAMRKVGPYFRNEWGADREAKKRNKEEWVVWLDQDHPQNSTLIKTFPLKELAYSIILWGLTIYFFMLCRLWKP